MIRPRIPAVASIVALSGATVASIAAPLSDALLLPQCLFLQLTGFECVLCGMTHAVAFALRAQWQDAGTANAAWWVILPLTVAVTTAMIRRMPRSGAIALALLAGGTAIRTLV